MDLNIKLDTTDLEDKLYLLAKESRTTPGQVIREETRLLTQIIMKFTPPQKGLAQGRNAIVADLMGGRRVSSARYSSVGLFHGIDSETAEPRKKDWATTVRVHLGWEGSKSVLIKKTMWRPSASVSELKAFHKKYQNPKTGRTGVVSQSVIGRWKVQDQMWVKKATLNRYIKQVQSMVGWATGSWTAILQASGGHAPNWITRHGATAGAAYVNFGENPEAIGVAYNVKIPGYQRMIDGALKNRERVTQTKIDRLIAGKATNLGFVTILENKT